MFCVLQTLFVCFLRASMATKVSPQLWDNLLAVLSSLTQWREVVQQWKVCVGIGGGERELCVFVRGDE